MCIEAQKGLFFLLKNKMKKILNKWQAHFYFGRNHCTDERGWKTVEFGILKFIFLPREGEWMGKEHYKGFFVKFYIWFPVDIDIL